MGQRPAYRSDGRCRSLKHLLSCFPVLLFGILRLLFIHRPLEVLRLVFHGKNGFSRKSHSIASLLPALDQQFLRLSSFWRYCGFFNRLSSSSESFLRHMLLIELDIFFLSLQILIQTYRFRQALSIPAFPISNSGREIRNLYTKRRSLPPQFCRRKQTT